MHKKIKVKPLFVDMKAKGGAMLILKTIFFAIATYYLLKISLFTIGIINLFFLVLK
jgi:hypothetical protein